MSRFIVKRLLRKAKLSAKKHSIQGELTWLQRKSQKLFIKFSKIWKKKFNFFFEKFWETFQTKLAKNSSPSMVSKKLRRFFHQKQCRFAKSNDYQNRFEHFWLKKFRPSVPTAIGNFSNFFSKFLIDFFYNFWTVF